MGKGIIYHDFRKETRKDTFLSKVTVHTFLNGVCLLLCGACIALSIRILWALA